MQLETGTENLSVTIKQIVTGNVCTVNTICVKYIHMCIVLIQPAVKEEDKWTDEGVCTTTIYN